MPSHTYFLHLLLTLLYSISQEHEDEVLEKLQNQVKLHDAKVGELNKKVSVLQQEKNAFIKQKNIPMAKRKIQEKHRVLLQIARFSQLKEACQNMQESISDSSVVKQTFTVLSDVSWTFRNVKFDENFNEQLSKFSEQVDDMKFDLAEMNDALSTVNTQDEELNEELEQELQELLEDPVATPAPTVPIAEGVSPLPDVPTSISIPEVQLIEPPISGKTKAADIFSENEKKMLEKAVQFPYHIILHERCI
ncbi:MAG: Snf7 family protein [Flavobacteriales bacterium]